MKQYIVNVLFDKWQGYHPISWQGETEDYFALYNVHHSIYPKRYSGYRILQRLNSQHNKCTVENEYFYQDDSLSQEDFIKHIPINHYICSPSILGEEFVYRIVLPITPPSSFFDGFRSGYYIRNVEECYNPRVYHDPFTFSTLKESCFIYINEGQAILETIDWKIYPHVGRDFLIKQEDIEGFVKNMEKWGWHLQYPLFSEKDVYDRLKRKENQIQELKNLFKDQNIREKYIYRIFQCIHKQQLEQLKGEVYIEIADIRNSLVLIWDEALELKNIYRKFRPLEKAPEINLEDIQELYGRVSEIALKETSGKHRILSEMLETIQWKKKYIEYFSDFNLLKDWIFTAMEPLHAFSAQLEIKDKNQYFNTENLHKQLIFGSNKYTISFDERIKVEPRLNKKDKTPQEQLKILLKDYKNIPEPYTKKMIEKQKENLEITMKMIKEMKSLYLDNSKERT
ncbi:hypothetical protein NSA47_02685 [Irregularibacter muris]|uniref:Uncharacterized protein n=1 Tax=Irregularibacter muris TaxID=1796619 RepID=A0AAE3HG00_9FIRM|nr:hypothetical protein [Irregularibacter muris]MCR1897893.1 hypothetical protein [Irregularibacter muris]